MSIIEEQDKMPRNARCAQHHDIGVLACRAVSSGGALTDNSDEVLSPASCRAQLCLTIHACFTVVRGESALNGDYVPSQICLC